MKKGFYLRLSLDGMRKNKRLYLPYLLTCAGMVMIFYILSSLAYSPTMRTHPTMAAILILGTFVIALFSLLFLFYTNAFLVRRRNKEFGLYNILGMNKGNLCHILLWETLLSALFSLVAGLAAGMLFAKLAEISLLHMANEKVSYVLSVEPRSIVITSIFFGVIFVLLLLASLARIRLTKPLDLLKSEAAGEKPPKANWLFAFAGMVILGLAYYLAVSIDAPLKALELFFIAVLMVIVATYLLFIAGSVALCKLLQRKKSYYYKSNHFVSVASMSFRMKRNGAGLASICILATMVLVMISSTSCLYLGAEDTLNKLYPYDLSANLTTLKPEDCTEETLTQMRNSVHDITQGREDTLISYRTQTIFGLCQNGVLDVGDVERSDAYTSSAVQQQVRVVNLLPLSDYNRLGGTELSLEPGQALIYSNKAQYPYDTFAVNGCRTLQVVGTLDKLPFKPSNVQMFTMYYVIVPDWEDCTTEIANHFPQKEGFSAPQWCTMYCEFNLPGISEEEQIALEESLHRDEIPIGGNISDGDMITSLSTYSRAENRSDYFTLHGSLFFLGIVLSIVFIAAVALIMYYKQLCEGYEDQNRFAIMQKVGMTKEEIKSTVNSQVLTLFFAPLLLAGVHLAFAFPFVHKILQFSFGMFNTRLFILTNIAAFLIFALFYVFVYRKTAKTYYTIVSDKEEQR